MTFPSSKTPLNFMFRCRDKSCQKSQFPVHIFCFELPIRLYISEFHVAEAQLWSFTFWVSLRNSPKQTHYFVLGTIKETILTIANITREMSVWPLNFAGGNSKKQQKDKSKESTSKEKEEREKESPKESKEETTRKKEGGLFSTFSQIVETNEM